MNETVPNGRSGLQEAASLLSSAVNLVGKQITPRRPPKRISFGSPSFSFAHYDPDDLSAAFSNLGAARLIVEFANVPVSAQRFMDGSVVGIDAAMKALAPIRDLCAMQYQNGIPDLSNLPPEYMQVIALGHSEDNFSAYLDSLNPIGKLGSGIDNAVTLWRKNFADDLLARSERLSAIAQASMDKASDPATMEKAEIVTEVVERLGCRRNTAGNRVNSAILKGTLEVVSEGQYSTESVAVFLRDLAPPRPRNTTIQVDDNDEDFEID